MPPKRSASIRARLIVPTPPPGISHLRLAETPTVSQTQPAPSHLQASLHALPLHGTSFPHPSSRHLAAGSFSSSQFQPQGHLLQRAFLHCQRYEVPLLCAPTVPCVFLTLRQGRDHALFIFCNSVCSRHSTVSGASVLLVGYMNIEAASPVCHIMCGETSPGVNTLREPVLGIEAS